MVRYDCGIDTGGHDIGLSNTDNLTVSYNQCYGGGTETGIDGITLNYCDVGVIEYNRIYDHIKSDGTQFGEDAIDTKGSSNIHIRYNVIYGNRAGGIKVNNSDAMKANSSNIHIYHNRIYGNGTNIVVSDVDENVYIWSNVIYGSTGGHGICCTQTGSNIHIYNNTLINNHGADGDKWAIVLTTGSDYYIKNNIFYSDTHNDLISKGSAATNVNLDYNHYCYTGGAAIVSWNGAKGTLTKLKAFGQEANGQEGDPLFTNVGGHDYTLQVGSPCKDTGTDSLKAIYADGLDPGETEWSTTPCTIKTTNQGVYGSWEKGAYIYTGSQLLKPPQYLKLK
ncbi:MAG: right-handed parallel beta-helix repeat-containing protein [Deltaproteobacteria bacterium]|nr:right-handed parallel beta-helix repeat-containing protein [Deltaproteobacteria bacterium]